MGLRARLLAFSTAQLIAFGVLAGVAFWGFRSTVLPMLDESLRHKAEFTTAGLGATLDIPLGADDRAMLAAIILPVAKDADLRYLEVRDASGAIAIQRGIQPPGDLRGDAAAVAHIQGDTVRAWVRVELEGVPLGSVVTIFESSRLQTLRRWTTVLALTALIVWLAALVQALIFSGAFVRPIHAMMVFTRRVARGELGATLDVVAPGELGELRLNLDQMSSRLAAREVERASAAAKELELQRELVAVSRMAGMAEVATGVLHNVGNVLNSLNVSVAVAGERLKQSKVTSLARTVELFDAHPDGLAGFLRTDKGKLVPQFLTSVAQRLAHENQQISTELASVAQNVEHIKMIVATQQSFAQSAGLNEPVALGALFDDALQMSEPSFVRHHIEIVREYGTAPTLTTHRHKLLQIIVNLLSNARSAIKESGPRGTITVSITERAETIVLAVHDTGVGITPENLRRVFQHGFTTKPDGHGFGLHSCANAARELGGSIAVASDGAGLGATFTVTLPRPTRDKAHDIHN